VIGILHNVRLFGGACDFTGVNNKLELSAEVEEKEVTTFVESGPAWKKVKGGLASSALKASGFWEAGDPSLVDDALWAEIGGKNAWTACPEGAAVGSPALVLNALTKQLVILGAVGDVAPWSAELSGSWKLPRGRVAHPPGTARTASGDGTALQLGAVTAGQHLTASLHVLSVAGTDTPTLTVEVESDSAEGMATPTTRVSFAAATGVGAQVLRTDGAAITDDWWRVSWTVSGTDPSFLFIAAFGIK
jgi:hypothetical protein